MSTIRRIRTRTDDGWSEVAEMSVGTHRPCPSPTRVVASPTAAPRSAHQSQHVLLSTLVICLCECIIKAKEANAICLIR